MKKYNNTKTIIAVSNKSAILVYVVSALMISTAAVYFMKSPKSKTNVDPSETAYSKPTSQGISSLE